MHLRYGRSGIDNYESVDSFPTYTTNKKASGFALMLSHTYLPNAFLSFSAA
jgi:hypothetical protein